MKIAVGTDHGGFELKEYIIKCLAEKGYDYTDFGIKEVKSVDYPDIAKEVGQAVARGDFDCGILFCGTGIGISIAANKLAGIRAALVSDCFSAQKAKEHNNANIICLGGRTTGPELAWAIVESYLQAEFAGGRHARRVDKIMDLC